MGDRQERVLNRETTALTPRPYDTFTTLHRMRRKPSHARTAAATRVLGIMTARPAAEAVDPAHLAAETTGEIDG